MIQQGWQEQYNRVLRSHAHLVAIADGEVHAGSDDARDALFHFFQDAYHLKDWLKNDDAVTMADDAVEAAVRKESSRELAICADLCNGTKHFRLDPKRKPKTGDLDTAFTGQGANVHAPSAKAIARMPVPTVLARSGAGDRTTVGPDESSHEVSAAGRRGFATHEWTVKSGGDRYDAKQLAVAVIAAWTTWLVDNGLLNP